MLDRQIFKYLPNNACSFDRSDFYSVLTMILCGLNFGHSELQIFRNLGPDCFTESFLFDLKPIQPKALSSQLLF